MSILSSQLARRVVFCTGVGENTKRQNEVCFINREKICVIFWNAVCVPGE